MIIKINKIGSSNDKYNWCTFNAVVNEFYTITGIASYSKDFELEENSTYKDLYIEQKYHKGKVYFNIFKK